MYEKAKPVSHTQTTGFTGDESRDGGPLAGGDSRASDETGPRDAKLRRIEWDELKARLDAARDLRSILRRDARNHAPINADGLANAATRYFQAHDDEQRDINPIALEHLKCSPCISGNHKDSKDLDPGKTRMRNQAMRETIDD